MTTFRQTPAIIALALSMATAATAADQPRPDAEAERPAGAVSPDSCAAAFATIMAQYLSPEINKQFPADTAAVNEFTRGVAHAFDVKNLKAPFYFGARNGFALIDRVEAMAEMGYPITPENFCAALSAALKGSAMGFNPESADHFLRDAMERINPTPEPVVLSAESQQQFLDSNRQRPGVETMPSGLLFEIITEGEGPHPAATDLVKVTYTGRLSDGTVFDSSDKPVQFPVNRLVPGFTEGLMLMKPGGEYRIFIPPALGYGDKGAAGIIPPGAALDFTVKLLEIMPQAQQSDKPSKS